MNTNASDTALLSAWQRNRDAEAFHVIVNRHGRLVYNTCRHIVRNDTDAADVAQECFLSLATTPPDIDRSLAGWLHRLATHRSLNHLKKQKRHRDREVRYASTLPDFLHPETDDLLSLIDEAIDALPDELRTPLVDHFFSRRSHQEVAVELGVPRRTVSYRINSGIEQLRTTLSKRGVAAPLAGLVALLEWQRAEAEPLPDGLHIALSKYAVAGAASRGLRGFRRAAFVVSGMSGTITLTILAVVALCLVLWLAPRGGNGAAPEFPPVATEEVENAEAGEGLASLQDNTANEAEFERAAAGAAQVEVAGGKVAGRVYDADTDAPITGAEVKIAKDSDTYNPVASSTTDAEGRYESEVLPPGGYMIYRGKTPGYGATSERMDKAGTRLPKSEMDGIRFRLAKDVEIDLPVRKGLFVSGVVVDGFGNGIANATVSARARFQNNGQTVQTAHDGTFYLAGFSSTYDLCMSVQKTGFGRRNYSRLNIGYPGIEKFRVELPVASRISGKVVQADGLPMANARVMAIHDLEVKRWPLNFPEGITDTEGNYSISGLGPGDYAVQVFSGGYRHISIAPEVTFVNLSASDQLENVDIHSTTQSGISVSGVVTEPDGTPISNGLIFLGHATRTDSEGRFTLTGLHEGSYRLESETDGYRTGFENARADISANEEAQKSTMGFITIDRDRDDLHLVLYRNEFTLRGRVLDAASEESMKYFEICTYPGHGTVPRSTETWHEAQRIASEDGSFRLVNLPIGPGLWSVVVRVPGIGFGTADLTVSPEATEADVTVMVSEGLSVSGVVVDHNNVPVEGAEIIVGPPFETRVAMTRADGTFEAIGLPPMTVHPTTFVMRAGNEIIDVFDRSPDRSPRGMLTAFHPDYPPVSLPIPNGKEKPKVRFQFGPSGAIAVNLTRDGKPVSMAHVSIGRNEIAETPCIGLGSKTVSSDGTATFSGVSPGACEIWVQARLGKNAPLSVTKTIEVIAGKSAPVEFELGGALGSISGTFLVDGSPSIGGVPVSFTSTGEVGPVSIGSDVNSEDGTWRLEGAPAGSGTLKFSTSLDSVQLERSIRLDLMPGEATVIDIDHGSLGDEAESSARLQGTIRIDGAWPQDAHVTLELLDGETSLSYSRFLRLRMVELTPEGEMIEQGPEPVINDPLEWSLEGVAAGSGTLTIRAQDADGTDYASEIEIDLSPDEERNLDIRLTEEDRVDAN